MKKSDVLILLGFLLIIVGFFSFAFAALTAPSQTSGFAYGFFVFPIPIVFVGGKPAYLVSITALVAFLIFLAIFFFYVFYTFYFIRKYYSDKNL